MLTFDIIIKSYVSQYGLFTRVDALCKVEWLFVSSLAYPKIVLDEKKK